jgi:hypothetical protein
MANVNSELQGKILTFYFYWWRCINEENEEKFHLHPPNEYLQDPTFFNTLNKEWHKAELLDMVDAKVDIALPVFWGNPHFIDSWSIPGLTAMKQALEELAQNNVAVPKVGMFFDTTCLNLMENNQATLDYIIDNNNPMPPPINLSIPEDRDKFYGVFRSFFLEVGINWPHLARVGGRPLVLIWSPHSPFIVQHSYSPDTFLEVENRFNAEFGVKPYICLEYYWIRPENANWDSMYRLPEMYPIFGWNGGTNPNAVYFGDLISVIPGYDDGKIVVDRENGNLYRNAWEAIIDSGQPKPILLETWNEFFEGSCLCNTQEFGRQYIDLSAHFVRKLRAPDWGVAYSHNIPTLMKAGAEATATVTITNVGKRDIVEPVLRVVDDPGNFCQGVGEFPLPGGRFEFEQERAVTINLKAPSQAGSFPLTLQVFRKYKTLSTLRTGTVVNTPALYLPVGQPLSVNIRVTNLAVVIPQPRPIIKPGIISEIRTLEEHKTLK